MRLDLSNVIERPAADVWMWYAVNHVENHPRWDRDMHLEQLTEGPIRKGTVIQRRHTHYGKTTEGSVEVVTFEPERAFGVVIDDGPVRILGNVSLEPVEGGTRLTIGIDIPGSTQPIPPELIQRSLDNIKRLIESEVPLKER